MLPETSGISSFSVLGETVPKAVDDNLIVSDVAVMVLMSGLFSGGARGSRLGPVNNINKPIIIPEITINTGKNRSFMIPSFYFL